MNKSASRSTLPSETRTSFSSFLRNRREAATLSLDEIARQTRIPVRSLEHLESGHFEKLPGDVFVRGFLRSYARCVGLDANDAIKRYARCGLDPAPVCSELADELLNPGDAADPTVVPTATGRKAPEAPATEVRAPGKTARRRLARGTMVPSLEGDEAPPAEASTKGNAETGRSSRAGVTAARAGADLFARVKNATRGDEKDAAELEAKELKKAAKVAKRAKAEAERKAAKSAEPAPKMRDFLPPILVDDEPDTARGGLTLAVIILVVVASLAMSYLLRRPSQSGDGVTRIDAVELIELEAGGADSAQTV